MTKKPRQRLVGRRRWAKVTRFLENAMVNGGSERIRTQAAMRLVDLLTLREQREIAELRRDALKERDAQAGDADTETEHNAPVGETREEKNAREVEESFAYLRSGGAARNDKP